MEYRNIINSNENENAYMEDYLYEKKKKFEMMKNRNKIKPSQKNNMNNMNNKKEMKSSSHTPIQISQCEKNILKNYEFKTKNKELAPMTEKVLSKQRLSIEKNLKINNNVLDRNLSTNTICLQGEEFNFDDFYIYNNNATTSSLKNRDDSNLTAYNNNYENYGDMVYSKRDSKLNIQNNLQSNRSSKIEIASQNNLYDSSNTLNKKKKKDKSSKKKNESIDDNMKKKKNSNSISSLSRKPSDKNKIKKINSNSIIQNSEDELNNSTIIIGSYSSIANSCSTSTSNTNLSSTSELKSSKSGLKKILRSLSRSSSRSKVNKTNNSSSDGTEKNDEEDVHKSEESISSISSKLFSKRNFSFSSLRLKKSKSNVSVSNSEHQSVTSTTTSGESKPLSRRNSIARSVMRKISSISKLAAFKSNDDIKSSPPPNTDSILNNEKKGLSIDDLIKDDNKSELGVWTGSQELSGMFSDYGKSQIELNPKNFERLCSILYYVNPKILAYYFEKAKGDEVLAITLYSTEHEQRQNEQKHNKDYRKASESLSNPNKVQPVIIKNNRRK